MKPHNQKFRKRPHEAPRDRSHESAVLRRIGEDISRREYAQALSAANGRLGETSDNRHRQGRVLSLVADSEFKRGAFDRAASIYLQAAHHGLDHHELWLRPLLGNVRALLKDVQVEQALHMAWHVVDVAERKQLNFDEEVRRANRRLAEEGRLEVPPVPPRVSVVATRLGYQFLREGEPEAAKQFFEKALETNPRGATRARQGLARVALAMDHPEEALKRSVDSIRRGHFGAKTLSSWPILIAARRRLGGWMISERLIDGLDEAPASIRARAVLIIVRELRKSDMRQWRQIAHNWSTREGDQFPIIEAEMRKMILASWKTTPGHSAQKRKSAERLLETPGLSPSEWLAGAKEYVRAGLWEDIDVDINSLIHTASNEYGWDFVPRVIHGLALSCMMAKRHDLARPLLQRNIRQGARSDGIQARSLWALARMEAMLGNRAEAASLYRGFSVRTDIPPRFRLQAQLLWITNLAQAGERANLLEVRREIAQVLDGVDDPFVLMDFARQLRSGPVHLRGWSEEVFKRGEEMALRQFERESNPGHAIDILFKVTRRQVHDFRAYRAAIEFWENMADEKKDWLWSTRTEFWQYLGYLMRAYSNGTTDVERINDFYGPWLTDPATPDEGWIWVGIEAGRWLLNRNRTGQALILFDEAVQRAPAHPFSALAWYWKALQAHKEGDLEKRNQYGRALRQAQGLSIGLLEEWEFDARALLLLADLNMEAVDVQAVNYDGGFLQKQHLQIKRDMEILP